MLFRCLVIVMTMLYFELWFSLLLVEFSVLLLIQSFSPMVEYTTELMMKRMKWMLMIKMCIDS